MPGQEVARECAESEVVAFKTIMYAHNLATEALPLLDADVDLRVVDVVRDPRAIYSSWRSTEPFKGLVLGLHQPYWRRNDRGWFTNLTGICDNFAANLKLQDHRVHRVVLEDLLRNPTGVLEEVYSWLGLPIDAALADWIGQNFDAANCTVGTQGAFGLCRKNSTTISESWRKTLPEDLQEQFLAHASCREVAQAYNFSLS
jgi:hypothetical protein